VGGVRGYDPRAWPPAAVAVDLVVLTIRDGDLTVLLVRRGESPYRGWLALPGGFVRPDETLSLAAARELAEETSLGAGMVHLEQLASYGDPGRDPRLRVVTVAYLALAPGLPEPVAGTDAAAARWQAVAHLAGRPRLAFDHAAILSDGVERARAKLEYTPLAAAFCPPEFTIAQLRRVYEIVWGTVLDPRNFHRKATTTPGFVVATGTSTTGERGRPARLYRQGSAAVLHPPLLQPGDAGAADWPNPADGDRPVARSGRGKQ
jgi:8-oxo-dGTP diphosphatase